jgi:hypothetical protein
MTFYVKAIDELKYKMSNALILIPKMNIFVSIHDVNHNPIPGAKAM